MSPHQEGTGSAPFQATRVILVVSHGLRPLKLLYAGLPRAALHSPILTIAPPRGPLIASPSQPRSAAPLFWQTCTTRCSPPFAHIDLSRPHVSSAHRPGARALCLPASPMHRIELSPRAPRRHLPRIPLLEERLHGSAASSTPLSRLHVVQHQEQEGREDKYEGPRGRWWR
ncbi:hypothetical protein B0H14DRAFT_2873470 [Mycena olivaceomarginata]|nr:hypothetical protein B0H14DRAFT_2873470 [Mycena olivaceomarginata]